MSEECQYIDFNGGGESLRFDLVEAHLGIYHLYGCFWLLLDVVVDKQSNNGRRIKAIFHNQDLQGDLHSTLRPLRIVGKVQIISTIDALWID